MNEKRFRVVGIGEVLFDILPSQQKMLGGAPANFAYVAEQLGNHGIILSRVGCDELGKNLSGELQAKNLSTDYLQIDRKSQTGIVKVTLENGQPSYKIVENVAWDFLELSEEWREIVETADAVCFGSLAQRNKVSRKTILEFVGLTTGWRVFDVNLRQNYFSDEILSESFRLANVVKLNHEELAIIAEILDINGENQICVAKNLLEKFALRLICITCGANGSLLIKEDEISENLGQKVEVKDAIGAGDAFTAALTHGLLHGWNLDKINQYANRIGAFVASQRGAMPDFPEF